MDEEEIWQPDQDGRVLVAGYATALADVSLWQVDAKHVKDELLGKLGRILTFGSDRNPGSVDFEGPDKKHN